MTYRVQGHNVMRPSKDYKKLEYAHVEALLTLLDEVRDPEKQDGGFSEDEINARIRLEEIKAAMIAARKKKIDRET
jgi:hypothetical protein